MNEMPDKVWYVSYWYCSQEVSGLGMQLSPLFTSRESAEAYQRSMKRPGVLGMEIHCYAKVAIQ